VKIWDATSEQPHKEKPVATLKLEQAATAVAFRRASSDGQSVVLKRAYNMTHEFRRIWLAIGLEVGDIMIFSSSKPFEQWTVVFKLPSRYVYCFQYNHSN
jgi:hypothetical protein